MNAQTTKKKSLLHSTRKTFRPFDYPWCYESWLLSEQSHWLHLELPMQEDVKDWKKKLTKEEKNFLTHILRFFTQGDLDVSEGYVDHYLPVFKTPEVRMMLTSFAARESLHVAAYSHLIETIGLPETTYNEFMQYKEMVDKHNYIFDFDDFKSDTVPTPRAIAKKIAVFSLFTEGLQLFSSFVMLLNLPRNGLMKSLGQIISWSIIDEECLVPGTEVLTAAGWKPIEAVQLIDSVLTYDPITQRTQFASPTGLVHKQVDNLIQFDGPAISQVTSPNHRMIGQQHGEPVEKLAKDVHSNDIDFGLILSGKKQGPLKHLTEKQKELCELSARGEADLSWIVPLFDAIDSNWAEEFLQLYEATRLSLR